MSTNDGKQGCVQVRTCIGNPQESYTHTTERQIPCSVGAVLVSDMLDQEYKLMFGENCIGDSRGPTGLGSQMSGRQTTIQKLGHF